MPRKMSVSSLLCAGICAWLLIRSGESAWIGRAKRGDDLPPLQNVVDNLIQEVNTLKAQVASQQTKLDAYSTVVAFHAVSQAAVTVPAHGTVILPHVLTNIGNAYDSQTGFFTAPVSGLYIFHATFMNADMNDYVHCIIDVNGTRVATSISDSRHGYYDNPAIFATVHMTAGQRAQLKSWNGELDHFYGDMFTSFTGVLIRAD